MGKKQMMMGAAAAGAAALGYIYYNGTDPNPPRPNPGFDGGSLSHWEENEETVQSKLKLPGKDGGATEGGKKDSAAAAPGGAKEEPTKVAAGSQKDSDVTNSPAKGAKEAPSKENPDTRKKKDVDEK